MKSAQTSNQEEVWWSHTSKFCTGITLVGKKTYQSIDEDIMSPLSSIARPVTCEVWPFIVPTTSPVCKFHSNTSVSMPPETIAPSGKRSEGGAQTIGPTKLECPTSVFERTYSHFFSGCCVQNLTVLSLDDVAIPTSPHIQIPRTYWKKSKDKLAKNQMCSKCSNYERVW